MSPLLHFAARIDPKLQNILAHISNKFTNNERDQLLLYHEREEAIRDAINLMVDLDLNENINKHLSDDILQVNRP